MNGGTWHGWGRIAGIIFLMIAGIQGLDFAARTAPIPGPASRFLHYYEALQEQEIFGLWERIVYSWILAGSPDTPGHQTSSS